MYPKHTVSSNLNTPVSVNPRQSLIAIARISFASHTTERASVGFSRQLMQVTSVQI